MLTGELFDLGQASATTIDPALTAAVLTPEMVEVKEEGPSSAMATALIGGSLTLAAVMAVGTVAVFRVLGKEPSTFWQIALAMAGFCTGTMTLGMLATMGVGIAGATGAIRLRV